MADRWLLLLELELLSINLFPPCFQPEQTRQIGALKVMAMTSQSAAEKQQAAIAKHWIHCHNVRMLPHPKRSEEAKKLLANNLAQFSS